MNIGQLTSLSSVLMYAHSDISMALGRLIGGSTDKVGVTNEVMRAVRGVDIAVVEFLVNVFDYELYLDVEIEINTNRVPAKAWFAIDDDGAHLVSVVAGGMDVMALISKEDIGAYKAEFIAECTKRKSESEADNAYEYEA